MAIKNDSKMSNNNGLINNPAAQIALFSLSLVILLIIASFLIPWKNVNWGKISLNGGQTITVLGEASEEQTNQIATFGASVTATNTDKQAAIEQVNTDIEDVIKTMEDLGINSKDIKTQNVSIYQEEDFYYEGDLRKTRKEEWRASNSIEIKIKDITKANEITNALAETNANNIWGPNFSIDASTNSDAELLAKAVENARIKADKIAKANNSSIGKIISITEGTTPSYSPMFNQSLGMGGGGADLQPGTTKVVKYVSVSFELEN